MSGRSDIEDRMDARDDERSERERVLRLKEIRDSVIAGGRIVPWQMAELLGEGARLLKASKTWKHSLSGGIYHVNGVCLRETDMTVMVKYTPAGEGVRFKVEMIRPISEWLDEVDLVTRDQVFEENDTKKVPRFVPVTEQQVWVEIPNR
jgi:hypothetical protein